MHTNSLTFPFFPASTSQGSTSRGQVPDARPSRRLGAMLRSLSFPSFRSTETQVSQPDELATRRAEKRLNKIAQRGQEIVLGTPAVPHEPLVLGGAPLAALRRFEGLAITITTRSSEILEQLDLLVELDLHHAVAVDIMVASLEPESADLAERLRAVSELAAHGLTSRVLLTDLPDLPLCEGAMASIRRLFKAAAFHRAVDVSAVIEKEIAPEWSSLLRYLRLEYGFPRAIPGRG